MGAYVTVFPQPGLTTWAGVIVGSTPSRLVKIALKLAGIGYTQHSKAFPGCSNGKFTNGAYTAETTVTGTDTSGNQVDFWLE